jgi:L-seryl-tRNA(Ser) seleniumtransferase
MNIDKKNILKNIPAVNRLLESEKGQNLKNKYSHEQLINVIRSVLLSTKEKILNSDKDSDIKQNITIDHILNTVEKKLENNQKSNLIPCINASGVIVHTNLGRSKLSKAAQIAVYNIAGNYSNLEINIESGKRGSRYSHVEELLKRLTGAESALVVNNNAAAVLLALNTLASGKEAIISRGQLVEIGGSFRIPDVMKQGNVILREVGCTNKTHLSDYEDSINDNTGVILQVHTSNYKIMGFTKEVKTEELVNLGKKYKLPILNDLGSGILIDFSKWLDSYEPTVQEIIASGTDVVTFSGDKLLGGPQAGIIVGKAKYIEAMKKNQLTRALRIDKFTIAALEATLIEYLNPEKVFSNIPTIKMITEPLSEIRNKAQSLKKQMKHTCNNIEILINEDYSQIGGGAFPVDKLKTYSVKIKSSRYNTQYISNFLRKEEKPIFTRIADDFIVFDMRTVCEDDFKYILKAMRKLNIS